VAEGRAGKPCVPRTPGVSERLAGWCSPRSAVAAASSSISPQSADVCTEPVTGTTRRRCLTARCARRRLDGLALRDGVANPPGYHYVVMWKKGGKVAMSREATADTDGRATFDDSLSLMCTMYREAAQSAGGHFAPKEASFTLLHCRDGKPVASAKPLGRSKLDLSRHAGHEPLSEALTLVLLHDGVPVGELRLTLASRWLKSLERGGRRAHDDNSLVSDSGSEASRSPRRAAPPRTPLCRGTDPPHAATPLGRTPLGGTRLGCTLPARPAAPARRWPQRVTASPSI
jgi:hypothetical protein